MFYFKPLTEQNVIYNVYFLNNNICINSKTNIYIYLSINKNGALKMFLRKKKYSKSKIVYCIAVYDINSMKNNIAVLTISPEELSFNI